MATAVAPPDERDEVPVTGSVLANVLVGKAHGQTEGRMHTFPKPARRVVLSVPRKKNRGAEGTVKELLRVLHKRRNRGRECSEQRAESRQGTATSALTALYLTVTLICDGYWREWWMAFLATTPVTSS